MVLGTERSRKILALAKRNSTTAYAFQLAVSALFYSEILDRKELLISTTAASRANREQQFVVGWLANFLAVRLKIVEKDSFADLLAQSDQQVKGLLANQDCPFAAVHQALGRPLDSLMTFGDPTRAESAWHQIGFNAMRVDVTEGSELDRLRLDQSGSEFSLASMTIKTLKLRELPAIRDLTLRPDQADGELYALLSYNRELFSESEAGMLERRYLALVDAALSKPEEGLDGVVQKADSIYPALDLSADQLDPIAID